MLVLAMQQADQVVVVPNWTGSVRWTRCGPENAIHFSLIDAVMMATERDNHDAGQTLRRILKQLAEEGKNYSLFQFPGQGQHATAVGDIDMLINVLACCPGKNALKFRVHAMNVFRHFVASDAATLNAGMAAMAQVQGNPIVDAAREKSAAQHKKYLEQRTRTNDSLRDRGLPRHLYPAKEAVVTKAACGMWPTEFKEKHGIKRNQSARSGFTEVQFGWALMADGGIRDGLQTMSDLPTDDAFREMFTAEADAVTVARQAYEAHKNRRRRLH